MMTLAEIKRDTIWVAKMTGWRTSGTYDEIGYLQEDEYCRDFDVCCKQPTKELQEFWNACWAYEQQNHTWLTIDKFYEIWANDPAVRELGIEKEPEIRPVIGKLSTMIAGLDEKDNVLVEGSGNHWAKNYRNALDIIGHDYDVVETGHKYDAFYFVVQCTKEALRDLEYLSNNAAIRSAF